MQPITYVLFGATGDLAQKKIMPALCALFVNGMLPEGSQIVAFSRRDWSDDDYRSFITPSLSKFDQSIVGHFLKKIVYAKGTFDEKSAYESLKEKIENEKVFFHLAVQPEFYTTIVMGLGETAVKGELLIEKPFGHDEVSARALEGHIEHYFKQEDILRIDHYLGKAGLVALLEARHDILFESRLNNGEVKRIEVRMTECVDIAKRGEFFDAVGALRDVGQNHMLSMLATLLMDLDDAKKDIQHARAKATKSLLPATNIVRAQYDGYRDTEGVAPDSDTETYFSFDTNSTFPRWSGVPIHFVSGKALDEKKSAISVMFSDDTVHIFDMEVSRTPDAYETVIVAALSSNNELFQSFEEVLASWQFIDVVRRQMSIVPLVHYQKSVVFS